MRWVSLLVGLGICGCERLGFDGEGVPPPNVNSSIGANISAFPLTGLRPNGTDRATVGVQLVDGDGDPVSGADVALRAIGPGASITTAAPTDAGGRTAGFVTSSAAIFVTVDVSSGGEPLGMAEFSFRPAALFMGFDEEAGSTVTDTAGDMITGTFTGNVMRVAGRFGGGLELDGTNSAVNIGYQPAGFLTNVTSHAEITVSAWVYPLSLGTWQAIFQIGGCNNAAALGYGPDGTAAFVVHAGGFGSQPTYRAEGGPPLQVGVWTHVTGAKSSNGIALYVNGAQKAWTPTTDDWASGNYGIHIGRSNNDESALREECATSIIDWLHARLDELRVYDFGLTGAQIQADSMTPLSSIP